ncbi:hypothetical protein FJY69_01760, partial [candidate division WOR-3 bacterium]|nr:hypothetical protein [candidate division WOR-3 bacterium]
MLSGASVFIGLSAQLNVGGLLDFSKEIEEFFHCYKAGLLERIHEGRSKLSRFYEPVNYIALGPFDIATLALVDDFDLGCCAFHPLDQHWPRTEEPAGKSLRRLVRDRRTFFHQTIMGPMPCFSPEHDSKDLAIGCLFRNRLPLLGICQLELQHGLLIGAGADFLRCAIKAIRRKFDQVKKQSPRFFRSDIELLILESHAWHELTLLLFARSFEDIIRFVLEVREWTIDEMSASLRAGDAYDLSLFLGADTLTSLYCRLEPRTSVAASHVFGTSATTLAFRTGLCSRGGRKLLATVCKDDILYETRRWSARAGHVQSALAAAVGEPPPVVNHPLKFLLCAGRGDIVTPLPGAEQTSSWRLVKDMMPLLQDDVRQHEIGEHLITRSTSICHAGVNFGPGDAGLKDNNVHLPKVGETHPYLGRVLEALPHTKGVRACVRGITKDILEPLKRLGVPKVVAARLVNAFALLAQGLQDPHLVSNMLELLPFMQRIRRLIERPPNELDLADLTRLLADHADKFELAWHNRYRGGWHLGEVSDFTLEYKGGIEQLVSAFDAAYKALSESLVGEGRVLALVSPQPSITSTQTAIRLNYHDIFTPEFFAARV